MHIKKHELNIYGTVPINYPLAEFYVAYTGKKPWIQDKQISAGDIEITVSFINVNYNEINNDEKGNILVGYAYLLKQFEYYKGNHNLPVTNAIDKALKDCDAEGYLKEYVNKEEFQSMLVKRWTVEQQIEDVRKHARFLAEEELKAEWLNAEKEFKDERLKAEKEKLILASRMLSDGLTIDVVGKYTNLNIEKIEELQTQLKN